VTGVQTCALPILIFDNGKGIAGRSNRPLFHLIEHYDEFYQEDDDEEIDLSRLRVPGRANGQDELAEVRKDEL